MNNQHQQPSDTESDATFGNMIVEFRERQRSATALKVVADDSGFMSDAAMQSND